MCNLVCSSRTTTQRAHAQPQQDACRAQLVARSRDGGGAIESTSDYDQMWAHTLPGPEQGCVLLANPLLFKTKQQYFRRAVILITDHDAVRACVHSNSSGACL